MASSSLEAYFAALNINESMTRTTEYDLYHDLTKELPRALVATSIQQHFSPFKIIGKDDEVSKQIRGQGNDCFLAVNYPEALKFYTKSLCRAEINGEAYALALAGRSACFFRLKDYQSTINDINLCLKAKYPETLKPKVYIRKAQSLKALCQEDEVQETLTILLDLLPNLSDLSDNHRNAYMKDINELKNSEPNVVKAEKLNLDFEIPKMDENTNFLNASTSVGLRYKTLRGRHVIATKLIKRGEVVFIEKAYAFSPKDCLSNPLGYKWPCQYCLAKTSNVIPCNQCTVLVFCNEQCRDSAWNEFHQWECLSVQTGMFSSSASLCGWLALRVLLQASHKGFSTLPSGSSDILNYGDKDNNYPYIDRLMTNFHKIKFSTLINYVTFAVGSVHYLRDKTDFFTYLKGKPNCDGNINELSLKIGGMLVKLSCQMLTNDNQIFTLHFDENLNTLTHHELGLGLFPSVAMLNNSCAPNVIAHFVGDTIIVKAASDIKQNAEIAISYIGSPMNYQHRNMRMTRQVTLEEYYHFKCRCTICLNLKLSSEAFNSYLCIKCKGRAIKKNPPGTMRTTDDDICKCLDCDKEFMLPVHMKRTEARLRQCLFSFNVTRDVVLVHEALKLSMGIFCPYHNIMQECYMNIYNYHVGRKEIQESMNAFKKWMAIFQKKFDTSCVVNGMLILSAADSITKMIQTKGAPYPKPIIEDMKQFLDEAIIIFDLHCPPPIKCANILKEQLNAFLAA